MLLGVVLYKKYFFLFFFKKASLTNRMGIPKKKDNAARDNLSQIMFIMLNTNVSFCMETMLHLTLVTESQEVF